MAKQAATLATQLIAAARGTGKVNRNKMSQQQLVTSCTAMAEHIARLVGAIKANSADPGNARTQIDLINQCKAIIIPAQKMVAAAKVAAPTIDDSAMSLQLMQFAKSTSAIIIELRGAIKKAEDVCGSMELEGAQATVRELELQLAEEKTVAQAGKLAPLPGESAATAAMDLATAARLLPSILQQLLASAKAGSEEGTASTARDLSGSLAVVADAVRGVAASCPDAEGQVDVLEAGRQLMRTCALLFAAAKEVQAAPADARALIRLDATAREVQVALEKVLDMLPGQRAVQEAMDAIGASAASFTLPAAATAAQGVDPATYAARQAAMTAAANALNKAAAALAHKATNGTAAELAAAAKQLSFAYDLLLKEGLALAPLVGPEGREDLSSFMDKISEASRGILFAGKGLSFDASGGMGDRLKAAVRALTGSINLLVDTCTSAGPGQKECDVAIRDIAAAAASLDAINAPLSSLSFFDCLDGVMLRSKDVGGAMAAIAAHAKSQVG